MSYQVFARKYRPKTFKDVLGQDHVVQTLRNAIEQERLAHAYLFVGPRGTGKTSTARILAKALNCPNGPSIDFNPEDPICVEISEGTSLDVLEIDGASNNGVDQVRDLRDNVRFAPTSGRYKIYYIDEVHMLSTAAFNALLKTLEEPPEHVKFIFATTEPQKILPTIISRCQRFDLRPISTEVIAEHLQYISKEEGVELSDPAAWAIAKGADGGMRDAQSMLDQLVAFCGTTITEEDVLSVFGFTSREIIVQLSVAILGKDNSAALKIVHQQAQSGKDLKQLLEELIAAIRMLLVAKVDANTNTEGISSSDWDTLQAVSKNIQAERLLNIIEIFAETESKMKWASNKRLHIEIGVIKAIQSLNEVLISDVITALAGAGPVSLEPLEPLEQAPPEQVATKELSPSEQPSLEDKNTESKNKSVVTTPQSESIPVQEKKIDPVTPEPSQDMVVATEDLILSKPETTSNSGAQSKPDESTSAKTINDEFFSDNSQQNPQPTPSDDSAPSGEDIPFFSDTSVTNTDVVTPTVTSTKSDNDSDNDSDNELNDLIAAADASGMPELTPEMEQANAALTAAAKVKPEEQKQVIDTEYKEEQAEKIQKLDESFYNDPLIKEALSLFKATITK